MPDRSRRVGLGSRCRSDTWIGQSSFSAGRGVVVPDNSRGRISGVGEFLDVAVGNAGFDAVTKYCSSLHRPFLLVADAEDRGLMTTLL